MRAIQSQSSGVTVSRRTLLRGGAALGLAGVVGVTSSAGSSLAAPSRLFLPSRQDDSPFQLPDLPYDYDALEPTIGAETMEQHHAGHHQAYVDELNTLLADEDEFAALDIEELIERIEDVPEDIRIEVRNNAGGHYNHSLFWEIMSPDGGGEPDGELAEAIERDFGDFETLREQINTAGEDQFGSGWVWLSVTNDGDLSVFAQPNQDNPLMETDSYPILGIDVWEHAYYLDYRRERAEYLEAWWDVVNWDAVNERYERAMER